MFDFEAVLAANGEVSAFLSEACPGQEESQVEKILSLKTWGESQGLRVEGVAEDGDVGVIVSRSQQIQLAAA